MRKSIWVYYTSQDGIDPRRDKTIRDFMGESEWYGSGIAIAGKSAGERDNSFDWSQSVEAKAMQLKNDGVIDRIKIFESQQKAA